MPHYLLAAKWLNEDFQRVPVSRNDPEVRKKHRIPWSTLGALILPMQPFAT
jgi:hypothetical protein